MFEEQLQIIFIESQYFLLKTLLHVLNKSSYFCNRSKTSLITVKFEADKNRFRSK